MLKKSSVVDAPNDYKDDLRSLMKQNPRRRGLGISEPFVWTYMKLDKGKQTKFKKGLKRFFGEEPIYLEYKLVHQSAEQMRDFLMNKGYFRPTVIYSIDKSKNKAKLTYKIIPRTQYKINKISYLIPDSNIKEIIDNSIDSKIIEEGVFYDSENLINERKRLAKLLNNKGYYLFSKNNIYYEVDTSVSDGKLVDINIVLNNPTDSTKHKIFRINEIIIEPDYSISDTIEKKSEYLKDKKFVFRNDYINKEVILRYIHFKKNDVYEIDKIKKTINQLSEIQLFKFVDISFEEINDSNSNLLDCYIRLTPMEKQEYVFETELNTTEETKQISTSTSNRYYGMAGKLAYHNRNLFKRAVQWNLGFSGAIDIPSNNFQNQQLFANYQIELNSSLYFPSAFLPKFISVKDEAISSKTAVNLSYYFDQNQDFARSTVNAAYTYQFNHPKIKHFVTPVDLSLIRTHLQPDFKKKLKEYNNVLLDNIFETHLLTSMRYSFVYNDKEVNKNHYWRIRATIPETAGNIPYFYNSITKGSEIVTDSTGFEIIGVNFFQYLKFDIDASYHYTVSAYSSIASRICLGIGLPFGNSASIPFEKRYFLGGANSMRAWTLRGLGPGEYKKKEDASFEQTGDLKFETNFEYRFDITSILKAALFVDAGNIWTLREDEIREGGMFEFNDFIDEIAIGTGVGLRFDFTFFIFRTDFAIPVRDPSLNLDERWVLKGSTIKDVRFNIGIGYPF